MGFHACWAPEKAPGNFSRIMARDLYSGYCICPGMFCPVLPGFNIAFCCNRKGLADHFPYALVRSRYPDRKINSLLQEEPVKYFDACYC
ncbi:hypothetical protein D1164_17675 [Mariniphaga sediminis]|uniref:Uncharacterized protein n=1 Tax=Mariniphaga sediminis TaxID=1628158 RepID=A0A399CW51_9BACT|nr:hypothetical protein D1164_17675 [Mariniphaga sediminis]